MPVPPDRARLRRRDFVVALTVAAAVVVSAPFAGELRRWLRLTFPQAFVVIVGTMVGAAALAALAASLWRIRDRRGSRYTLVGLAATLAVAYSQWSALGTPESDVVEHVHFIEYGIVTWLFYRAWWALGDGAVLLAAFFAAFTVGTCEEWFEWFIPARVGELRDVLLNGAAIVSGLLVSLAIEPLPRLRWPRRAKAWSHVFLTAGVAVAALASFLDCVHLGYEIHDAEGRTFRSIYTAPELAALASARAHEWATAPPLTRPRRLSREDQYMSEGLLHVQARNILWAAGDLAGAWHENRILEEYFAPVLDTPSYVSAAGHRWAPSQRTDAEARGGPPLRAPAVFVSQAQGEFPIFTWPHARFRTLAAVLVVTLLAGAYACRRRATPAD
jgi:VanZ family protein